ncbi:Protein AATF [Strongyloides ratti]|uniref:Protein AATF n=1 Tax=Strongyloides ratti TaxID=34506 RepID=A0A090LAG1_STRRB|nr:Protein AATF [Strongyloides ratti]CEF66707.1 Protein AATF [Strongyloides ratti]
MGLLDDFEKAFDPKKNLLQINEDEDYDGTWASSLKKPDIDLDKVEEVSPNRRKMKDLKLLDETDEKYKGTKVSRKDIFGDECEPTLKGKFSSDDEEMDDEEEIDDEEEVDDDEEVNDEEHDNENVSDEEEDNEVSEDEEDNIVLLNKPTDTSKSDSIKQQMTIWDKLMRVTIKAHSAMRVFNQLPRDQVAKDLENQKDAKQNIYNSRRNILEALKLLVDIEGQMVSNLTNIEDSDNEEIPSSDEESDSDKEDTNDKEEEFGDEEDEENEEENSNEEIEEVEKKGTSDNFKVKTGKGFNSKELAKKLKDRHNVLQPFRTATLKKWDEKTRLISVKAKQDFSKFSSNINKQIDRIMADKARLLRKSQTKRGDCIRIGDSSDSNFDVEIFDDTDFYQLLLKDLIDRKTIDTSDPIQMSKQWLEIEKLRQTKRKKKNVNQKASKGRKCMLVTIPKLVNFFPAQPETVSWSNERRTELFKSLFVN